MRHTGDAHPSRRDCSVFENDSFENSFENHSLDGTKSNKQFRELAGRMPEVNSGSRR
jgi:hypothetical protein